MNLLFKKIFVTLAILLVCGHSIFPHHHMEEDHSIGYHQPDEHHDDGFFSSGNLDSVFLPGYAHHDYSLDAGLVLFTPADFLLTFDPVFTSLKTEYSHCKEFPPPQKSSLTFYLRGPPQVS